MGKEGDVAISQEPDSEKTLGHKTSFIPFHNGNSLVKEVAIKREFHTHLRCPYHTPSILIILFSFPFFENRISPDLSLVKIEREEEEEGG